MSLPTGIQKTQKAAAPAPKAAAPKKKRAATGRIKTGLTPEEFFALDSGMPPETETATRSLPDHLQQAHTFRCGMNLYPSKQAWQTACASAKQPGRDCACQQHLDRSELIFGGS